MFVCTKVVDEIPSIDKQEKELGSYFSSSSGGHVYLSLDVIGI